MRKWLSVEEMVSIAGIIAIQIWVYSQTGGFFADLFYP